MMRKFLPEELKKLSKPHEFSSNEDNGQVTIIGGSKLFHGAPILALKTASRIVDMVFFASPEPSVGKVAENLKSKLSSFIWIPWEEIGEYIKKSDSILIGPGLMRYHSESKRVKEQAFVPSSGRGESKKVYDEAGNQSKEITEKLLRQFPNKQWVIDAGSLQVMEPKFISSEARNKVLAEGKVLIPKNAILTPNQKEFEMLFGEELMALGSPASVVSVVARKHHCIIVLKGVETIVCSPQECVLVEGGNAGLTKGGTGDVLAGLTVALAAKNPPFLAACAASLIVKKAAEELSKKVGFAYNADDLAEKIPEVLGKHWHS
ncbi:MAG: ADP-dependent (S)-NAD(P)H-hydrate dehydratase [Microgenomates group bacterium LiPW_31]|nr:MAG: ADP-dependent (S)-NAD(P)H-hydrate dehydratase [Microgenomates group bacterium LiPW_31]